MEVGTKLKGCVIISLIAVILKIVAIASPGWTVVKTDIFVNPMDDIMPEDDGIHVDPEMMKPHKEEVTVSFGFWYYKVCKHGHRRRGEDSSEEDSDEDSGVTPSPDVSGVTPSPDDRRHKRHHRRHHKCYHRCYRRREHKREKEPMDMLPEGEQDEEDIPREFRQAGEFIRSSVDVARHARLELAWYATVGLGLGVVGLVGAIVYARYGGLGKHSGRLACSTQILSAFFFFMAVIRVASYMVQLRAGKDVLLDRSMDIEFECPWCLWVAAIGASLMGLVSLFHMLMISRDRNNQRSEYYFHGEKNKIPFIAPKGYEQLIVPPMYEEAGPLPEKKPIS